MINPDLIPTGPLNLEMEDGPDPLADQVVGTIICPATLGCEHKIYRSELFQEFRAKI